MKVLVAGHWEADSVNVLDSVAEGLRHNRPDLHVDTLPFGPGTTFQAALEACGEVDTAIVTVPNSAVSTAPAGAELRRALKARDRARVIVEGGHSQCVDAGVGFVEAFLDVSLPADFSIAEAIPSVVDTLSELVRGWDILVSTSTARPLVGLASVMAVDADLKTRTCVDAGFVSGIATGFRAVSRHRHLPLLNGGEVTAAQLPGSGAGGGVAAWLAAAGARLVPTGDVLTTMTGLRERVADVDLLVVAEPILDSPVLAEKLLDTLSEVAAECAIPVVAVARSSSLSKHERAQWGLHGVITVDDNAEEPALASFMDAGRKIAHTWMPRR